MDEVRQRGAVLRIAPVGVPTREAGRKAEVFPLALTEAAHTAALTQPRDSYAAPDGQLHPLATGLHPAHHLVPRHDPRAPGGQVALDEVQIGAADPPGRDMHPDLARTRRAALPGALAQRPRLHGPRPLEFHDAHIQTVHQPGAACHEPAAESSKQRNLACGSDASIL